MESCRRRAGECKDTDVAGKVNDAPLVDVTKSGMTGNIDPRREAIGEFEVSGLFNASRGRGMTSPSPTLRRGITT